MKDFLLFLKSKHFRIHLVISLALVVLVFWLSFKFLNVFTLHGNTFQVPDFTNIKTEKLDDFILDKNLSYHIIDSVFDFNVPGGVVVKQDPEKNSAVKQNRIVYLTVSAKNAPLVKMPNLVDASMRQALALIQSFGLKVGKRRYKNDPCVNCVLSQSLNGKIIKEGEMVSKGSVIDLVLGRGEDGEKINVPCLIKNSYLVANQKIVENGFIKGSVVCNDCKSKDDKENATVVGQIPNCSSDNMLEPGSSIDLYLSIHNKRDYSEDASPDAE